MSKRRSFEGLREKIVADPERRERVEEIGCAYDAALGGRLEIRAFFPDHPEHEVSVTLPREVASDRSWGPVCATAPGAGRRSGERPRYKAKVRPRSSLSNGMTEVILRL